MGRNGPHEGLVLIECRLGSPRLGLSLRHEEPRHRDDVALRLGRDVLLEVPEAIARPPGLELGEPEQVAHLTDVRGPRVAGGEAREDREGVRPALEAHQLAGQAVGGGRGTLAPRVLAEEAREAGERVVGAAELELGEALRVERVGYVDRLGIAPEEERVLGARLLHALQAEEGLAPPEERFAGRDRLKRISLRRLELGESFGVAPQRIRRLATEEGRVATPGIGGRQLGEAPQLAKRDVVQPVFEGAGPHDPEPIRLGHRRDGHRPSGRDPDPHDQRARDGHAESPEPRVSHRHLPAPFLIYRNRFGRRYTTQSCDRSAPSTSITRWFARPSTSSR